MNTELLFSVRGKVALVTGGTRGIGYMIADGLVRAGARVYISSRKAEACAQAAAELSAHGEAIAIPADLGDPAGVAAVSTELAAREPKLDILVNNAGANWGAPFESFPQSGWDKVMDLNVRSIFFLTQQLAPLLKAAATPEDPARVINIGSVDGMTCPDYGNYSYAASKAAVHHLTRHLAKHLAAADINVNAIAPGPFPTKMTEVMLRDAGERIFSVIPRRRTGLPSDIAGSVIFLASAASAYITGAVIPVDGGFSTTR
ncbi:SDR family oxidoreductase [Sphingomonas sp. SFZ2018-12]|uniref:SDR family oxidoreductase n=1 Tax=Sphingomonas sp. SFZ2018-12 TaxID=2683197 RepID=UPI0008365910|nr:SDR family oxidoreductase [Sphingomonas sp. SFZ2018-12]MCH4893643.1 SDR family oxidoreductase [Sphingomonas sp. SFZ2018-12]